MLVVRSHTTIPPKETKTIRYHTIRKNRKNLKYPTFSIVKNFTRKLKHPIHWQQIHIQKQTNYFEINKKIKSSPHSIIDKRTSLFRNVRQVPPIKKTIKSYIYSIAEISNLLLQAY